jgi:hypothetical protein
MRAGTCDQHERREKAHLRPTMPTGTSAEPPRAIMLLRAMIVATLFMLRIAAVTILQLISRILKDQDSISVSQMMAPSPRFAKKDPD